MPQILETFTIKAAHNLWNELNLAKEDAKMIL